MQPPVADRLRCQRVLSIVAQHYRRPTQRNFTNLAFTDLLAVIADNADLMARQRASTADQRDRCRSNRWSRPPSGGELVRGHTLDMRLTIARRKGSSEDMFRQTVARQEARCAKAGRRKTLGEGRKRRRVNGFGAA